MFFAFDILSNLIENLRLKQSGRAFLNRFQVACNKIEVAASNDHAIRAAHAMI